MTTSTTTRHSTGSTTNTLLSSNIHICGRIRSPLWRSIILETNLMKTPPGACVLRYMHYIYFVIDACIM